MMAMVDMCDLFSVDREGSRLVWEVETLWEVASGLPVVEWPVSSLEHLLDEVVWFDVGTEAKSDKPTARAVAEHSERIYSADLTCPILLSSEGLVMDGMHRLAKAWMTGCVTVKVRKFTVDPAPSYTESVSERA